MAQTAGTSDTGSLLTGWLSEGADQIRSCICSSGWEDGEEEEELSSVGYLSRWAIRSRTVARAVSVHASAPPICVWDAGALQTCSSPVKINARDIVVEESEARIQRRTIPSMWESFWSIAIQLGDRCMCKGHDPQVTAFGDIFQTHSRR